MWIDTSFWCGFNSNSRPFEVHLDKNEPTSGAHLLSTATHIDGDPATNVDRRVFFLLLSRTLNAFEKCASCPSALNHQLTLWLSVRYSLNTSLSQEVMHDTPLFGALVVVRCSTGSDNRRGNGRRHRWHNALSSDNVHEKVSGAIVLIQRVTWEQYSVYGSLEDTCDCRSSWQLLLWRTPQMRPCSQLNIHDENCSYFASLLKKMQLRGWTVKMLSLLI